MSRAAALAIALLSGMAAAGAGGCRDPQLARLEAIRQEVCACKTAACGAEAMKRVPQEEVRSDHRSQRVARAMLDCLARLYEAEAPATDPDAPAPEAEPAPAPAPAPGAPAPAPR